MEAGARREMHVRHGDQAQSPSWSNLQLRTRSLAVSSPLQATERLFLHRMTRSYDVAWTHQLSGSSDMYLRTRTDSPRPRPRSTCCRTGRCVSPLDDCVPI